MAYSNAVNDLKKALNSYSAEEEKLTALYQSAIADAEKQHAASLERIEKQYASDRNTAYSDTVREERNLFNLLSQRGLGSSGEAAQAKLNSNVVLANRLGALEKSKADSALELDLGLSNTKTSLLKEEAAKKSELGERKNNLASEIAKLELDRETAANELKAKYDYLEASKKESEEKKEEENKETVGYVPEVSASELAKQLVKSATSDGKYIDTDNDVYRINKYLLELQSRYDINEDYYNDLVIALTAYGYESISESDKRYSVISVIANKYYNTWYDQYYNDNIDFGMDDRSARLQAEKGARLKMFRYAYERCKTIDEFRKCCLKIGVPSTEITEFLKRDDIEPKKQSG